MAGREEDVKTPVALSPACTAGSLILDHCLQSPALPSQGCMFMASCTGRNRGGQRPNTGEGQAQPGQIDFMLALPFGLVTFVPN